MTHQKAGSGLRRYHHLLLTLLVGIGLVNGLDRATLAIANPLIRHDLGISLGEMGLLLSGFFWIPIATFTGSWGVASAIAAPLLTCLMLSLGWRWMFLIMGLLGVIASSAWFAFYRDPGKLRLSHEDHVYLAQDAKAETWII